MTQTPLSDRERLVLEAVIETYVQTAEPAGSRTISRHVSLGLSAATIRNTMSDLEDKGYLYHPHTSAGRIPTDLAYRVYVDILMRPAAVPVSQAQQLRDELHEHGAAIEEILSRAAQVLGVLTKELGVAVSPSFIEDAVLERLELIQVSSERLLMALTLKSGLVRTIFVEVPAHMAADAVVQVAVVLNERLAGLSLREIRSSLADRLRDAASDAGANQLLNIFVQEADDLFDVPASVPGAGVVLGSTTPLAAQPEFASSERLHDLIEVTDRRDLLRRALAERHVGGLTITIGSEHADARLAPFTLVTSPYRSGALSGVIGVLGPTRMPYDKIIALVEHTSRLVGELLEE
jgi:heat-inducible transcriptional repressor